MTSESLKKIFESKQRSVRNKTNRRGEVREIINQGFETTTFEQFENWFNLETFNQGCFYCGLTNQQSLQIYNAQRNGIRIDGTRGGKRGKRLEIDRRDPNLSYDNLNNLVWCCYWCNNAKTNFFTEDEFRPIGQRIGDTLRAILENINQ